MAGNLTTDTYIVITNPWSALLAGGGLDLITDCTKISGDELVGTGQIVVVESYVADKSTPMEPLKVERNSGKTYDAATCRLYSDIHFSKALIGGSTARIIN